MMTSGFVKRMEAQSNDLVYFDMNKIKQHDRPEKDEFQVEFRHVRLILLGYVCAILLVIVIFAVEVLCGSRKTKVKKIRRAR